MRAPILLNLALSVLLTFGTGAQSPLPEATATPAPTMATPTPAMEAAAALEIEKTAPSEPAQPNFPDVPQPPKLEPLAPIPGRKVIMHKGFPFNNDSGLNITIGDGDDAGGPPASDDAEMLKLFLPIVITAIVFFCPILIIAVILIYRQRKNRLLHQTILGFVEKGQPIPAELLSNGGGGKTPPTVASDRRRGLMLTSIGIGLIFFFLGNDSDSWGIGFIPLGVGIGYLLTSKFAPRGVNLP